MKHLLFLFLTFISLSAFSQSAVATLDATGTTVSGGDGTGTVKSIVWTIQGTPPAAVTYVSDTTGLKSGSNSGTIVYAKITQAGNYTFNVTATDNLGQTATGQVLVIATGVQKIILKIIPTITVYLKP